MTTRTAVVTGGNRGIGLAVAERLLGARHRVVVTGRDEAALEDAADRLSAHGDVEPAICDVTDEEAVDALLRDRRVDVLVNNAGTAASAPVGRITLDDWNRLLAVNATGAFLCTRAVLGGMRQRDWGRIVTVASIASHHGAPYIAAYVASKHAVLGFTRAVAAEVAGSGVTANAVCPAYVDTEMSEQSIANIQRLTGRSESEARRALEQMTPLARLIAPEEVAAAVAYLVSDDAAAVNGQSIIIDGGGLQQ